MSLAIHSVTGASDEEWDAVFEACDYATFFHSRNWSELWRGYSDGKIVPAAQRIEFSDGALAILPVSLQKGTFATHLSSPAGTYGGWIARDALGREHTHLLARHLLDLDGGLKWRLNPYYPCYAEARIGDYTADETHALSLDRDFRSILQRSTKGHKSAATKARREGVTTRLAATPADWRAYYELYASSLERWGDKASSRYEPKLFESLARLDSRAVRLWLAEYQGKAVAGALCFYTRWHVAYWHGAASGEHFHLRPVQPLIYDAIQDACERGARWFDFNPSGGHEGVKHFKRGFGTEVLASDTIVKQTFLAAVYTSARGVLRRS